MKRNYNTTIEWDPILDYDSKCLGLMFSNDVPKLYQMHRPILHYNAQQSSPSTQIEISHLVFKLIFSNLVLKLTSKYRPWSKLEFLLVFFASIWTMERYFEASLRTKFEKISLNNGCENSIVCIFIVYRCGEDGKVTNSIQNLVKLLFNFIVVLKYM